MKKGPVNKSLDDFIRRKKKELIKYNKKKTNTDNDYKPYGISIVLATMRQHSIASVFDNYSRQDFENKEMIIVLNNNSMVFDEWASKAREYEDVKVFQLEDRITLGECLNFGVSQSKYNYIAKFDDDDYYGPKYLSDSIKAFNLVDADMVGKSASFVYFEKSKTLAIRNSRFENRYVKHMDGSTFIIKRGVFDKIKFADVPRAIDVQFSKDCIRSGFKIYSTNRYHHVYIRHGSPSKHTWKISDEDLLRKYCKIVKEDIDDYRKYVDI